MSAIEDVYPDDLDGAGLEDECKYTVVEGAPFTTSSKYWKEYHRVCKIVASHPEGAVLNQIVAELYGRNEVESGSTEYQRIRRFLNSNPRFFRVRKSNGLIFCQPTLALFDLIKRGIIQRPGESPQYAGNRQFCEDLLRSIRWDRQNQELINDKGRNLIEQNLSEYLERINDLRLVLRSEFADPEYLSLPYKTRFNDESRIKKQHAITGKCLETAGEDYKYAVLLTLTTDPKKFGSLWEMWCGDPDNPRDTGINGNWNRLMSWLSADSRLGSRPDYVKVLEATEKGMPHFHAIVFLDEDQTRDDGMPWLESKNEISRYWGKYQGTTVDMQPLIWQDELPEEYDKDSGWVRWDRDGDHGGAIDGDQEGYQTAGQYLGKYLSAIYGGIRSAAGLEDTIVTDGGRDLPEDQLQNEKYQDKAATWKVAMYWVTRRKIRTESRDLRQKVEDRMEDDDDEDKELLVEAVKTNKYEFVGAYSYDQIPAHIRNGLVDMDALLETLDDLEVRPGAGDSPPPLNQVERLRKKLPSSAWPLVEGLLGNQ